MNDNQKAKCHACIHTASTAAAAVAVGLTQIPLSDCVPIAAIQTTMVVGLAAIFDISISKANATSMVATCMTTMTGKVLSRAITQIIMAPLPGLGNAVSAATAASLTEALGWKIASEFYNRMGD